MTTHDQQAQDDHPQNTHTQDHHHDRPNPESIDWEAMYTERDQRWSGRVNGSLVAEVAELPPGRALDVGCGEGADAIWLAEQGWRVAAVDVSPTAIERGATESRSRNLDIEWTATDMLDAPPTGGFDLVALHYPAFAIDRLADVTASLTGAVEPDGVLLVVGHAPPVDPTAIPFDPADWVQPDDIAAALDDDWAIEVHETRPRPGDHHHGSPHTHDVVLRARKRTG